MAFDTDIASELQDSDSRIFTPTERARGLTDALRIFSRRKPRKVTETCYTVASSRLVDISGIKEADLIWGYDERSFNSLHGVEYPTGSWPRDYRSYIVIPDDDLAYLEMDIDSAPSSADAEVKVRCYKFWTEDTLPAGDDDLIIRLAAGLVAQYKPLNFLNLLLRELKTGDGDMSLSIEEMSGRIDQAQTDIASARGYNNTANVGQPEYEYLADAAKELQVAMSMLNEAKGFAEHDKLRMQVVNLAKGYEAWGMMRVAQVEAEINKYCIRRPTKNWDRS